MTSAALRLPAEWEPQAGVLLAWPHEDTDWAARLPEVESTCVAMVAAITRYEPVIICVSDKQVRDHAAALLADAGVAAEKIRFVEIEYDDTWLRDSGPITLSNGAQRVMTDFRFTGWGGKFQASHDDCLVAGMFARNVFPGAEHRRVDWALEGGAIESDGAGTLLTTWRCLHHRHPELGREQMTRILSQNLGADRVLWLERGYLQGDDTDAHIDTLARFAPDDAIVFQACDDAADPHFDELAAMREELAALRTLADKPYRLHALPWARPIFDGGDDIGGRRLAASYANYLVVNDAVLVPAYGDPADAPAAQVIGQAHPGRHVVAVPCKPLIWQNGSLHCMTMQLPQGVFG
jgi:agmatine/peptidylarginine deiminase